MVDRDHADRQPGQDLAHDAGVPEGGIVTSAASSGPTSSEGSRRPVDLRLHPQPRRQALGGSTLEDLLALAARRRHRVMSALGISTLGARLTLATTLLVSDRWTFCRLAFLL